jgi:hypothetical protein
VSRMREAIVLALGFRRPARFDLAAHWKRSTAAFKEQQQRMTATLALSPDAVRTLESWWPMRPSAGRPAGQPLPEGFAVFDVDFESLGQAKFVALGLGAGAKALAPGELIRAVQAEIARMGES